MAETAVVEVYSSSVVAGWDAHKPDNYHKLFEKYGQGIPFIMGIMDMGMTRKVSSNPYFHHEDTPIHAKLKVNAIVADPGAGLPISFVLHADSLDANNKYYVRLQDQIKFNNGNTGIVTNIVVSGGGSTVTVTVTPNLVTETLGALAAGEFLAITSNSFEEKTGQPLGRLSPTQRFENYPQIIKETIDASGTELTNAVWYTVTDKGRNINGVWSLATFQGEVRQMLAMSGAMLLGQKTTNTALSSYSTHGLFPELLDRGIQQETAADTWALADLSTISLNMDRQHAFDRNVMSYLGSGRYNAMEDALTTQFQDANTSAITKAFNSQLGISSLEATLNFKCLSSRGKSWGFRLLDEFRNPEFANFVGSPVPQYAFYAGTGKVKDPKSGAMNNKICAVTKAGNGENRRMIVWKDGAMGKGIRFGDQDASLMYWLSEIGNETFAANQIVFQHVA